MPKILIVEDDAQNNQMIRDYLEGHGYSCTQAYSGSEGKLLYSLEKFDLVLLDLMLPGIAGEELVSLFAETLPVIVLSAKSRLDSKVEVLSAGAEDYICKPFDLPELLVRIRVQLRRWDRQRENFLASARNPENTEKKQLAGEKSQENTEDIEKEQLAGEKNQENAEDTEKKQLTGGKEKEEKTENVENSENLEYLQRTYTYKAWTLNPDTQEMTAEGELVELTRHEFLILELLIRNPKRVFTKQMIYEYAWGEEYLAEDKTISVHISNIRAKLKRSGTDTYIQTVWGMGFKLS